MQISWLDTTSAKLPLSMEIQKPTIRIHGWFPRDSIRGPLAHQPMTWYANPACVAARAAIWCPFGCLLDDVIAFTVHAIIAERSYAEREASTALSAVIS